MVRMPSVRSRTGVPAYIETSFVEGDILEGRGSYRLEDLALFRDADGRPTPIDTRVLREVIDPYIDSRSVAEPESVIRMSFSKFIPMPTVGLFLNSSCAQKKWLVLDFC